MLFVHDNNFEHKIRNNYKGKGEDIKQFKADYYVPTRNALWALDFSEGNRASFDKAADICNYYYSQINRFSRNNKIAAQSKFASTFLEELSVYLFKDIPAIKSGQFDIFNKGVYAGIKLSSVDELSILKKDVDFCIGKRIRISIEPNLQETIIIPVVAVEVKTYLDATMFGEVKSSSKAIRSATPSSKTYVLMGYKDLADEHLLAARQDSTLTEMFALRKSKHSDIESDALFDYWEEINDVVNTFSQKERISLYGRLLFPGK